MGHDVIELFAGADFTVAHEDNARDEIDIPTFRRLYVGIDRALSSDTLVGFQGVVGNLASDTERYSQSVFLSHKFRTSERGAIYVNGGFDYNYQKLVAFDSHYALQRVGVFASASAQVQVTPVFALRVGGSAQAYKYIDDYHPNDDSFHVLSAGGALLVSVTERTDVTTYFEASSIEDLDVMVAGLTLTTR